MDLYRYTIEQWTRCDENDISRRLVMALDAIGFSEKTRETVTDYTVVHDILDNINSCVLRQILHCHATMGSRREGTTNYMLQSDHDAIHYSPSLRMFETVQLKTNCPFNTHLITLKDSCTPIGYTKIQLVQNEKIIRSETEIVGNENFEIYHFEKFKTDPKGRFVLSNEFNPYNDIVIHARNGPADTISHKGRQSIDNVRAYLFDDIPEAITPWFSRLRPQGWPSMKSLELCQRMGCFVVPVGQANSGEKQLEWRYSMSFQERYLMLNLNEAQYKCYILLKLINKFIIKPKFGDFLTSYHCKTCLFYTIEKVGTGSWTTQNLLKNLKLCLEQLQQWLKDCTCPNFFVQDENMFSSRLNNHSQCDIREYLKNLIKANCIDLVCIKFENFWTFLFSEHDFTDITMNRFLKNEIEFASNAHTGLYTVCKFVISYDYAYLLDTTQQHNATKCFDIVKSCVHGNDVLAAIFMITLNSKNLSKCAKVSFENAITFMNCCLERIESNSNGETILPIELAMRYIFYSISELKQSFHNQKGLKSYRIYYDHCREKQLVIKAIDLAITRIFTDIASSHVAEYVRTKSSSDSFDHLLKSIHYFDKGKAVNYISNRLKFARLLFILNLFRQCHCLLNKLVTIEKETIPTCICYDDDISCAQEKPDSKIFRLTQHKMLSSIWTEQNEETRANMRIQLIANNFTNCVIYDYYELETINAPLYYEAFRSFGTPTHSKVFVTDFWYSRAVFDPVVYLHYMLIECNDQLNDRGGSAASLDMLENLLIMNYDNSLWHLETAINLVGHLYIKKGWTKLARECFRKSMNIRPLHNAAKWHIMFMLFGR